MGLKWKKFFVPGVSGALLGFAAVLARRRSRRSKASQSLDLRGNSRRILMITEEQLRPYRGQEYLSRVLYTCEPSAFKVWRFLRPSSEGEEEPSQRIYHVTPVIEFKSTDGEPVEIVREEKFYATLHALAGGELFPETITRGALIEFHRCHVGGSMNGIETGEKVVSRSPVATVEVMD